MKHALFFDIDGTLVSYQTGRIPPSALEALRILHERGHRLFLCTGRPPGTIELLGDDLKTFPWDGIIAANGQVCMDKTRRIIRTAYIPTEVLMAIVPWLEEHQIPANFYELDFTYSNLPNPLLQEESKRTGKPRRELKVLDARRSYTHSTIQVCPYMDESMDAEFLALAPGIQCARWTNVFADMIPNDGGKQEGIKAMLEHIGFPQESCITFGDGGNDIQMLKYAPIGVAMGNAPDHVKAAADLVTDHVDQDGLVNAFRTLGLLD